MSANGITGAKIGAARGRTFDLVAGFRRMVRPKTKMFPMMKSQKPLNISSISSMGVKRSIKRW